MTQDINVPEKFLLSFWSWPVPPLLRAKTEQTEYARCLGMCIIRKSILQVFMWWDSITRDKIYQGPVACIFEISIKFFFHRKICRSTIII